jgi:hypothetical protein
MAKTAVFEAMMGSNLYCMNIIMCFLAHLAIGHMNFYHQVSFVVDGRAAGHNFVRGAGPSKFGLNWLSVF